MNTNATEVPLQQEVRAMNVILSVAEDIAIDDKYAVQMSEYCFNVRETLENAIRERNPRDLDEPRVMMKNPEGVKSVVQRATTPLTGEEVESTLHALKLPPLGGPSANEFFKTLTSEIARGGFDLQELNSLMVDAILSSKGRDEMIHRLSADDAQILINGISKALETPDLPPVTRKKFLKLLYKTCGYHARLPTALQISAVCEQTSNEVYKGGYADVWKGKHRGQDVAVKVIRTYSHNELQKIINRFCKEVVIWRSLQHPNVLPLLGVSMSENRLAMISEWMPNGNINQFIEAHPEENRLELLAGVAKGLIYLHNNDVVHGDLKGANVLINQNGQALLADFGLLTIVSDPANILSSSPSAHGGTVRWMSPELIDPEHYGLEKSSPTKSSDCYALGMVILETISGKLPFRGFTDFTVSSKVMKGERPRREAKFDASLWRVLEMCWASEPDDRPSIEDVLQNLEPPAQDGSRSEQATEVHSRQIFLFFFLLFLVFFFWRSD